MTKQYELSFAGILLALLLLPGCLPTYGQGKTGRADISASALHHYLKRAELARPEVEREILDRLRQGKRFRKSIMDQRNRWCRTTVWIDYGRRNILHIVTDRNETCPDCKGSGKRKSPRRMANMPFELRCIECDSKGYLPHKVIEREYVLSSEDFKDADAAWAAIDAASYKEAPPEARKYVNLLASKRARERLTACDWLDRNYIRVGKHFHEYLPMLKKALWREQSERKRVILWRFHAGKDLAGEEDRAYYRVYADSRTGKILRKGFFRE